MVLLAVVSCISMAIAGGASLLAFSDAKPLRIADRAAVQSEPAQSPDKQSPDKGIIYVSDQPTVRVVGAPFVPNTNPRER